MFTPVVPNAPAENLDLQKILLELSNLSLIGQGLIFLISALIGIHIGKMVLKNVFD